MRGGAAAARSGQSQDNIPSSRIVPNQRETAIVAKGFGEVTLSSIQAVLYQRQQLLSRAHEGMPHLFDSIMKSLRKT